MKRIAFLLVALLVLTAATPQPELLPPVMESSPQEYMGGEHTPLQWTGVVTVRNAVVSTTEWIQIGRIPIASVAAKEDNKNLQRYNPEKFTLTMNCRWARLAADSTWLADSAYVRNVYWEHRWDTTASTASLNGEIRRDIWALDSSNYCVKNGAFNSSNYLGAGGWQAESFNDTTKAWQVPLRLWEGGYYQFNFESTSTDTFYIYYTITGEH